MGTEDDLVKGMRLKFYGLNDYATFFQAERAVTVLAEFDRSRASYGVNDIVELHNASRFVEHGVFPASTVQAAGPDVPARGKRAVLCPVVLGPPPRIKPHLQPGTPRLRPSQA